MSTHFRISATIPPDLIAAAIERMTVFGKVTVMAVAAAPARPVAVPAVAPIAPPPPAPAPREHKFASRKGGYHHGMRDKGISAHALLAELFAMHKTCAVEFVCAAFEKRMFARSSVSPAVTVAVERGFLARRKGGLLEAVGAWA